MHRCATGRIDGDRRCATAIRPMRRRAPRRTCGCRDRARDNPRTRRVRARAARRASRRRRLHPRGARVVPHRAVLLHAGAADCSDARSGRRVPVRHAARILRALRERVRRAAARRGHSRARGHRLPGRRDQPARRLHDRAPVRRARLGRGAHRRQVAALRSDRRRRAVAHRARPGRRAAVGRAGAAARAARRRLAQAASQLTWDAVNHDWRRHVIGFNYERAARRCGANGNSTGSRRWQVMRRGRRAAVGVWVGAAARLAHCGGAGSATARARSGTSLCRRLARAGLPRQRARRAARLSPRAQRRAGRNSRSPFA